MWYRGLPIPVRRDGVSELNSGDELSYTIVTGLTGCVMCLGHDLVVGAERLSSLGWRSSA